MRHVSLPYNERHGVHLKKNQVRHVFVDCCHENVIVLIVASRDPGQSKQYCARIRCMVGLQQGSNAFFLDRLIGQSFPHISQVLLGRHFGVGASLFVHAALTEPIGQLCSIDH